MSVPEGGRKVTLGGPDARLNDLHGRRTNAEEALNVAPNSCTRASRVVANPRDADVRLVGRHPSLLYRLRLSTSYRPHHISFTRGVVRVVQRLGSSSRRKQACTNSD